MKLRTKRFISRIISPLGITILKLHTSLTGQERARIVLRNERQEVLLVCGYIGRNWTFPGGGIEKGEQPMDAVLRELYEETSIIVKPTEVRLLTVFERSRSPVGYTAHIFISDIMIGAALLNETRPLEIVEMGWFDLQSLPAETSPIVHASLEMLSKLRRV